MKVKVVIRGYGKADNVYNNNIDTKKVKEYIHYDIRNVYENVIKDYKDGNLTLESCSKFITNIIREIFFFNLETEDKFSVSDISHIDDILFNHIEEMIKSAINKNLSNETIDAMLDSIIKTSDIIDYKICDEGIDKIKTIFNLLKDGEE